MSRGASLAEGIEQARSVTPAWKLSGPAAALAVAALLLLFWQTTAFTVHLWESNAAYSHGYLVVPISLFLIWRSRSELARLTPRSQPWGLLLLFGFSAFWALANLVGVQLVMQISLLALVGVMLWTLLGTDVSRSLAFPVGYLLLGIPVWSLLIPVLQDYTAIASTRTLRAVGVPVHLEVFYISIPSGQFVVEDVCAGLRYLLATVAIAALFAHLHIRRLSLSILFVVAAIVISVIMNWIRVVIIILAGHLTSMEHFLVRDHVAFGWGVFVVALVPIFFLGSWLQRFNLDSNSELGATRVTATTTPPRMGKMLATTVTALIVAATGPATILWATSRTAPTTAIHLEAPAAESPWRITDSLDTTWGPDFLAADAQLLATYADGDNLVSLYVAYYAYQRDGVELINELNALYDDKRWKPRQFADRTLTILAGQSIPVREIELVDGKGGERLLWYWFRLGGQTTSDPYMAKILQLGNTLIGANDGAVIAVSAMSRGSLETTRTILRKFLETMVSPLESAIGLATTVR